MNTIFKKCLTWIKIEVLLVLKTFLRISAFIGMLYFIARLGSITSLLPSFYQAGLAGLTLITAVILFGDADGIKNFFLIKDIRTILRNNDLKILLKQNVKWISFALALKYINAKFKLTINNLKNV
jgi:hypothetical protein